MSLRLLATALVLLVGMGSTMAVFSGAKDGSPSVEEFRFETALRESQGSLGRTLSDWRLTDAEGRSMSFSELRGKPLVLSLVFTSCDSVCPTTTRYLSKVIETARDALGEDSFQVAMLGFDSANDSPLAMKQYARQHGVHDSGWHLLSADPDTVAGLTEELGFTWFPSPAGFDHIAQVTVIDAEGSIYRQVYGESFGTPNLVDPLIQLVLNRRQDDTPFIDDLVNRVRFFCTSYDPNRDAYFFDYSLFLGMIIGALVIIGIISYMIREYLFARRCRREARRRLATLSGDSHG